ncbi:isopentenyl phosphate kinase [Methanohalophilus sp.]|uniref:isopentenyl phosphate kinase n=1 Tax=Methanohalophilus sp. TaxID=1966352 RepID=UPI002608DA84|nr:isopentenyl phosphate kinase [Methanohalophilus sp.]
MSGNLTILKLGGSVITDKNADEGVALKEEISRLAKEISSYKGQMIIVHGAGSFGHPLAHRYSLVDNFDAEGLVLTHRSVKILNSIVVDALNESGVKSVGVHSMDCFTTTDGRISSSFLDPIRIMIEKGIVPVLHGDVVMDSTKGVSIVSGDQVLPYLALAFGAGRIGLGSAEDGVLDENGNPIPLITNDNFDYIKACLGGSACTDVTGGMLGKVRELLDMCHGRSMTSYIFNAKVAGNVLNFLNGEEIGTAISDSLE